MGSDGGVGEGCERGRDVGEELVVLDGGVGGGLEGGGGEGGGNGGCG